MNSDAKFCRESYIAWWILLAGGNTEPGRRGYIKYLLHQNNFNCNWDRRPLFIKGYSLKQSEQNVWI